MAIDLTALMQKAEGSLMESGQLLRTVRIGVAYGALYKTLRTYLPHETAESLHKIATELLTSDSYQTLLPKAEEAVGAYGSSGDGGNSGSVSPVDGGEVGDGLNPDDLMNLSDDEFRAYLRRFGSLNEREIEALVLSRHADNVPGEGSSVIQRSDADLAGDEEQSQPPFMRELLRRSREAKNNAV